jgi:GT2 family glycosyltransferase
MKLLVIILNFHVTELTIDCLRSIAPEIPSVPGMRVAVCENGTGGDAEARLREAIDANGWSAWAELTAVHPNRGFTGGNNVIIRKWMASSDPPEYFHLLNADTLAKPGAFKALVDFMDAHPAVGVGGGHLEFPDGSPQNSPRRFLSVISELDRGLQLGIFAKFTSHWQVNLPELPEACRVDWVSGASMIIRRQVIDAIGPLDEGLYTYFDDVDYCLNATRAGWETWFVPGSRVVHFHGASTGIGSRSTKRLPEYWYQARRRFFLKNYGALYTAFADAAFLSGCAAWRVRRRIQRKPETDPEHMLIDSLRNSVFMTGFKVREVPNPALAEK